MNNRYYLIRHGESFANRKGLIVSDPANALRDFGLTAKGAEQVMQAALKTRLDENTLIISSDFLRARETAEIFHGIICASDAIVLEARLRERDFGNWELQDHENYKAVWRADLHSPNDRVNGVESVTSVLNRGMALVSELEREHSEKNILLVGHGDVLQILLAFQKGVEPRYHRTFAPIQNAELRSLPIAIERQTA